MTSKTFPCGCDCPDAETCCAAGICSIEAQQQEQSHLAAPQAGVPSAYENQTPRPVASVGSRSVIVHFACNDHRNGHFAGEAEGCSLDVGGESLELEGWSRRFVVDEPRLRFRIHGAWFPFMSSREWVGNWCWNAYRLKRPQALRLIAHLRWHGWTCSGGRTRLCNWYDRLPIQPQGAVPPLGRATDAENAEGTCASNEPNEKKGVL